MRELHVDIKNKIATYNTRGGAIVCENNNYKIRFTFDDEWNQHTAKQARFIWNDKYLDVVFTGDTVPVPVISQATILTVGVYAGEKLRTTTPAKIPCMLSILCESGKAKEADYYEADGTLQHRLPAIRPEDNNKLLQAVDGKYELREAPDLTMNEEAVSAALETKVKPLQDTVNQITPLIVAGAIADAAAKLNTDAKTIIGAINELKDSPAFIGAYRNPENGLWYEKYEDGEYKGAIYNPDDRKWYERVIETTLGYIFENEVIHINTLAFKKPLVDLSLIDVNINIGSGQELITFTHDTFKMLWELLPEKTRQNIITEINEAVAHIGDWFWGDTPEEERDVENFGEVAEARVKEVNSDIREWVEDTGTDIKNWIDGVGDGVSKFGNKVENSIAEANKDVKEWIESVGDGITNFGDAIETTIENANKDANEWIDGIGADIKNWLTDADNNISNFNDKVGQTVEEVGKYTFTPLNVHYHLTKRTQDIMSILLGVVWDMNDTIDCGESFTIDFEFISNGEKFKQLEYTCAENNCKLRYQKSSTDEHITVYDNGWSNTGYKRIYTDNLDVSLDNIASQNEDVSSKDLAEASQRAFNCIIAEQFDLKAMRNNIQEWIDNVGGGVASFGDAIGKTITDTQDNLEEKINTAKDNLGTSINKAQKWIDGTGNDTREWIESLHANLMGIAWDMKDVIEAYPSFTLDFEFTSNGEKFDQLDYTYFEDVENDYMLRYHKADGTMYDYIMVYDNGWDRPEYKRIYTDNLEISLDAIATKDAKLTLEERLGETHKTLVSGIGKLFNTQELTENIENWMDNVGEIASKFGKAIADAIETTGATLFGTKEEIGNVAELEPEEATTFSLRASNKTIVGAVNNVHRRVLDMENAPYQSSTDENLETNDKTIAGGINEVNSKTTDKIYSINTSYYAKADTIEVNAGTGVAWQQRFEIANYGNANKSGGIIYHRTPIVAGENVTFEVDSDKNIVKINAKVNDKIIDLKGTTWVLNDDIDTSSLFEYAINFSTADASYSSFKVISVSSGYANQLTYDTTKAFAEPVSGVGGRWNNEVNKTISITGGTDAINTNLINWLYVNGELQTEEIYQTKQDNNLETESKEIVGAINELNDKINATGGGSAENAVLKITISNEASTTVLDMINAIQNAGGNVSNYNVVVFNGYNTATLGLQMSWHGGNGYTISGTNLKNGTVIPAVQSYQWDTVTINAFLDMFQTVPCLEMPQIRFAGMPCDGWFGDIDFYLGEGMDDGIRNQCNLKFTIEIVGGGALQIGDTIQICRVKSYGASSSMWNGNTKFHPKKKKLRKYVEYIITEEDLDKRFITFEVQWNDKKARRLFEKTSTTLSGLSPLYFRIRRPKGDTFTNRDGKEYTSEAEFSNVVTVWKACYPGAWLDPDTEEQIDYYKIKLV